jgi:hypothetical protein
MRVMLNNADAILYVAPIAAYVQIGANVVTTTSWRNVISDYYTENFATITRQYNGFHYHIHDSKKIYFISQENVQDFILHIDQKILDEKPYFLAWDAAHQTFGIL